VGSRNDLPEFPNRRHGRGHTTGEAIYPRLRRRRQHDDHPPPLRPHGRLHLHLRRVEPPRRGKGRRGHRGPLPLRRPWRCAKTATPTPYEQFVWGVRYVHGPVLRWRDTTSPPDGSVDETLYYTGDANFNVTALVDTSGTVLERIACDPYGKATFYDGNWSSASAAFAYANDILFTGHRLDPETGLYSCLLRHPTIRSGRSLVVHFHASACFNQRANAAPLSPRRSFPSRRATCSAVRRPALQSRAP